MRLLVFGAKGYLGHQFLSLYADAVASDADIADPIAVEAALNAAKPDIVINAAGKTGKPNVDWCEDHKLETIASNVTGPLVLLDACMKQGIYLVHLSSGCIYEGDNEGRGFSEDDPPNFSGSFYARSKAWADQMLSEFPVLILRLRMPFDGSIHDRNLIMKLRKYKRVLDVKNSLTFLPDFLEAAKALIVQRATGIFNIVNPGAISPFEIMNRYKEIVDPGHTFDRLLLDDLSQVVKAGRSNCILDAGKLANHGVKLQNVDSAIAKALGEISEQLSRA